MGVWVGAVYVEKVYVLFRFPNLLGSCQKGSVRRGPVED